MLPLPASSSAQTGTEVTYGTRPEDLVLTSNGAGLDAEVAVIEPTGAETLVVTRVAGHEVLASFKERYDLRPGQKIRLMPNLDNVHLFNAETGRRLTA